MGGAKGCPYAGVCMLRARVDREVQSIRVNLGAHYRAVDTKVAALLEGRGKELKT